MRTRTLRAVRPGIAAVRLPPWAAPAASTKSLRRLGVAAITGRQEYQAVSRFAEHALEPHADAKRQVGAGDVTAAFEPGESVVQVTGIERAGDADEGPDFRTETRHGAQPFLEAGNRREPQELHAELQRLGVHFRGLRPGFEAVVAADVE